MMLLTCLVSDPQEAAACVDGWLRAGIPMSRLGLLLSESTQSRATDTTTCGSLAMHAVRIPSMGIMAAGAIVEDLAGVPAGLVDALMGLGLLREPAEEIHQGIQQGGLVVVGFTDSDVPVRGERSREEPAAAPPPVDNIPRLDPANIQFLNIEGLPSTRDPMVRRFCLLEVD